MSFSRINGPGWAVGDKVTSAQMNALDIDHANALDKTTAGDTIVGVVTVNGVVSGLNIGGLSPNGLQILSGAKLGILGTATVQSGGSLVCTGTGKIIAADGTVHQFTSPVGYSVLLATTPAGYLASSGFVVDGVNDCLKGNGTLNSIAQTPFRAHHSATLSSVTFYFSIVGGHGALPAVQPAFGIYRRDVSGALTWLNASQTLSPNAASVAAYEALTSFTYPCTQNNVIDVTAYEYFYQITDESGTNALANDRYRGVKLNFTGIADMRFA